MSDTTYAESLESRYLAIHPEHADFLGALPPEDRRALLALWLDTFEGQRHRLADECERTALDLHESHPEDAEKLWRAARELRETPIARSTPPPRLT